MEDDFRNLTAIVWANFIKFMYVALSCGTLLIFVMSQQYNCLMELYAFFFFTKCYFSWKCIFPLLFILRYVRVEMNVHAFMNEFDQNYYWYIQEKLKIVKIYTCTKSMESCPLVISHILAEFYPERTTYTTLHNKKKLIISLKSAQTFTVGFVKLLSTHPIHIVVLGKVHLLYPFHIKPIMQSQRRFENNAVWCERSESALFDTGVKKAAFNVGGLQLPREVFWKRILAKSRSLRRCGCQCEKVYRIMRRERPKVILIPALVTVCMDGKRGWQKPTKNRRDWRER